MLFFKGSVALTLSIRAGLPFPNPVLKVIFSPFSQLWSQKRTGKGGGMNCNL
jgi:hypothetical protein